MLQHYMFGAHTHIPSCLNIYLKTGRTALILPMGADEFINVSMVCFVRDPKIDRLLIYVTDLRRLHPKNI